MLKQNKYKDPDKKETDPDKEYSKAVLKLSNNQLKLSCGCCCFFEIRSVSASLPFFGYSAFDCDEGSTSTQTRYLRYRASGDSLIEGCGVQPQYQRVSQQWEVDPLTGAVCYSGPESGIVSRACGTLQSCSATSKKYVCSTDGTVDACGAQTSEGDVSVWSESLSDAYTIQDVSSNVDSMLNRANPYRIDGVPAGKSGSVLRGTNTEILTWSNGCASNRATHEQTGESVSKTRLFVQFTKDAEYTLTSSTGSVQKLKAKAGQRITVDPPPTPNTWVEISIHQKTTVGCCNTSMSLPVHTGRTTTSIFVPDGDDNGEAYHIGPDCKKYTTIVTTSVSTQICAEASSASSSANFEDGTGGQSESSGSGGYSNDFRSTIVNVAGEAPIIDAESRVVSTSEYSSSGFNKSLSSIKKKLYTSSTSATRGSCNYASVAINNGFPAGNGEINVGSSSTLFPDPDCKPPPVPEGEPPPDPPPCTPITTTSNATYDRYEPCSSCYAFAPPPQSIQNAPNCSWSNSYTDPFTNSNIQVQWQKRTAISGATITTTVVFRGLSRGSYSTEYSDFERSREVYSSSLIYRSATIQSFVNPYNPSDSQGGTWETNSSTNQSLCALRNEQSGVKTRSNVDALFELTFTAPTTEKPVTYYHWFHYYTVESGISSNDCSDKRVVAHNEQWVTKSTGGQEKFQRKINISTPSNNRIICAYAPVFITRDVQP